MSDRKREVTWKKIRDASGPLIFPFFALFSVAVGYFSCLGRFFCCLPFSLPPLSAVGVPTTMSDVVLFWVVISIYDGLILGQDYRIGHVCYVGS